MSSSAPRRRSSRGLVDALAEAGIEAFGPRRAAAQLEGSKGFTKDPLHCLRHSDRRRGAIHRCPRPAKDYIRTRGAPIVVKADGLASGKGVVVAQSVAEAEAAVDQMLGGLFGAAGQSLVIEDCLEARRSPSSRFATGGRRAPSPRRRTISASARATRGPNTGGMGAIRQRR